MQAISKAKLKEKNDEKKVYKAYKISKKLLS